MAGIQKSLEQSSCRGSILRGTIERARPQERRRHTFCALGRHPPTRRASAAGLASTRDRDDLNPSTRGLDGGMLLTHNPVDGGVNYDDDRVTLSDPPGTGILGRSGEN